MQIESYEKGCEICGYDPANLPDVSNLPAKHQPAVISGYKLFVVSEASWKGEGKAIDWNNRQQDKWSPYFWLNQPGFRFNDSSYGRTTSGATCGSRFAYPSEEDSDYHGQQHIDLYRDVMTFPQE